MASGLALPSVLLPSPALPNRLSLRNTNATPASSIQPSCFRRTIRSNPAPKYPAPVNTPNPGYRYDPNNPTNPANRYIPSNPFNPANEYNPQNPMNPANRYDPGTPFRPLNRSR